MTCDTTGNASADGDRAILWSPALLYREIEELAAIFDVSDGGGELVADFEAREQALRQRFAGRSDNISVLFWFSSAEVAGDAWAGAKMARRAISWTCWAPAMSSTPKRNSRW